MIDFIDIFTLKNALRLLIYVFLFGYVTFAFLLMLRIKILAQTLETVRSGLAITLARGHFLMVLIGSIVVALLVLL